ncbi:precorrin-8X methylmutase [Prochlorothrix hollandica]|uniref:Cobalt-precorrin-8X methylmutase n=1 Tax=Prochlorothrix hollandica PCC 9006 = CALU 1027 TaxID=317619 RepID=A0A0M2PX54_PROHO|nr:precorrin-8X methylmutase [Prochlorothrix hollandica]KKJ00760.1 cobalt-precorrin-8X methylmutase [Prochlorothrix hollandica PCC 9006 = CALU 1027]
MIDPLALPPDHPIVHQSFAMIDGEIGAHGFSPAEYAIVQRMIHSTADFDLKDQVVFQGDAIDRGIAALRERRVIVTDVTMVRQGIAGLVKRTLGNPLVAAIDHGNSAIPGKTRSETGMAHCIAHHPRAIYVIGNAPTALLALCEAIAQGQAAPALVVGVPVGFVAVTESKAALAQLSVPQIRVDGRKGGSPVAAAIVNALVRLALADGPMPPSP